MSWIADILKDIPLSTVLKEKISLLEQEHEKKITTIEVANSELQAQIKILDAQKTNLETQLQDARRKTEQIQKQLVQNADGFQIDETVKQILVFLAGESEYLPQSYLADRLQMHSTRLEYYIAEMENLGYVHGIHSYMADESTYRIGQKGREYVVKNGLL